MFLCANDFVVSVLFGGFGVEIGGGFAKWYINGFVRGMTTATFETHMFYEMRGSSQILRFMNGTDVAKYL